MDRPGVSSNDAALFDQECARKLPPERNELSGRYSLTYHADGIVQSVFYHPTLGDFRQRPRSFLRPGKGCAQCARLL
jgi:hypothetical protein